MNDRELHRRLNESMPEVPARFHQAMEETLQKIVTHEQTAPARAPMFHLRRTLAFVLVFALLGTAAIAAYHWNIFDALTHLTGHNPENASQVMQTSLTQTTVNGVEITVSEAGYDGRTLFLRYSYRLPDAQEAFGVYNKDGQLTAGLPEGAEEQLRQYNVGWWTDNFWIDGQNMDMFGGSSGVVSGSEVPGEIVHTEYWRLDVGNVYLKDRVEISLPIGEKPDTSKYFPLFEHPEWQDANGNFKKPDEGLVTFMLDTGDVATKVITEHPNIPTVLDDVTIQVSEAAFSPLMTYITLDLKGNPEALEAYKSEHGEGLMDEQGNLIIPYSAMDVHSWAGSLHLVDKDGHELFTDAYGCSGFGDEWAEYLFPCIKNLPDELYLAPFKDWAADMSRAVRVR